MSGEIVKHGGVVIEFTPAEIGADFEAMKSELASKLSPYEGLTIEGAAHMDIKQAKACRAELRAWSKDLNDARKAIKRVYTAPLTAFEGQVKELDALIAEPVAILDRAIKTREQAERAEREAALLAHYEGFAGEFAQVVPLDRFIDPSWLNKAGWTFDGEEWRNPKAFEALENAVVKAAQDWATLQRMAPELHDYEAAKLYFFDVLDLGQTIEHDAQSHEAALELARLEHEQAPASAPKTPQDANSGPRGYHWTEYDIPREWRIRFTATEGQFNQLIGALDAIGIKERAILREREHDGAS